MGMTIPDPESRSQPAAMMSIAVLVRADRICDGLRLALYDLSSAAIAAACGAAAEVPAKGANPGTSVVTSSAAVISGFRRTAPPVAEHLPGGISQYVVL